MTCRYLVALEHYAGQVCDDGLCLYALHVLAAELVWAAPVALWRVCTLACCLLRGCSIVEWLGCMLCDCALSVCLQVHLLSEE